MLNELYCQLMGRRVVSASRVKLAVATLSSRELDRSNVQLKYAGLEPSLGSWNRHLSFQGLLSATFPDHVSRKRVCKFLEQVRRPNVEPGLIAPLAEEMLGVSFSKK